MAKSSLPLLLLGGAAVVLVASASSKKKTKKKEGDADKVIDDVIDEVDEKEKQEDKPTTSEPSKSKEPAEPTTGEITPSKPSAGSSIPSTGEVEPPTITPSRPVKPPTITPSGPAVTPGTRPIAPSAPAVGPVGSNPPLGPSAENTSVASIYARQPEYVDPSILRSLDSRASTSMPDSDFYFNLNRRIQKRLYDAFVRRMAAMKAGQESPSIRSVIVREELKKINSGTPWEDDISTQHPAIQAVWDSGLRLAYLASLETALGDDPDPTDLFTVKSSLFTVPRQALGFSSDSARNVQRDQRIEFIATDRSLENAEHLIGRVIDTSPNGNNDMFRIEIVRSFQGKDAAPSLSSKHGFKAAQKLSFPKKAPTGIYRIFPRGMV